MVDEYRPESAMVVVAHPDDAEFMVTRDGGEMGEGRHDRHLVVITKGDKGSEDPEMTPARLTKIREAETARRGRRPVREELRLHGI